MVEAQGGDPRAIDNPDLLTGLAGTGEKLLLAPSDGSIKAIDALDLGLAAAQLGGGRGSDGSAPDPGVGVELELRPGDSVRAGQPWARLRHRDGQGLEQAEALAKRALLISPEPAQAKALLIDRVGRFS